MSAARSNVESARRTALIVGILFLLTFVTAIAARLLFGPVRDASNYIAGADSDAQVALGAVFELGLIITNVGTALYLFPILKRQHEALGLGYVAARLVECTFIAIGLVSLLAVVLLRQDLSGAAGGDAATVEQALVALYERSFLLGPGFIVGVGNGLILGYLMYRSGLVPRGLAMLGLIGGPLIIASGIAIMFDVFDADSAAQGIATIPEFFWELGLGLYLTFKGFKPSPLIDDDARAVSARTAE
jgi:Domain of unknown function (DUF4386)